MPSKLAMHRWWPSGRAGALAGTRVGAVFTGACIGAPTTAGVGYLVPSAARLVTRTREVGEGRWVMRRTRWSIACVTSALALLVAGCGDDNGGGRLTVEEFFVALEVLDDEYEAATDEQAADLERAMGTATSEEERVAAFVVRTENGSAALRVFVDGLAELNAPAELADLQDRAVSAGRAAGDSLNDITTALGDVSTGGGLEAVLAGGATREAFDRFRAICFEAQTLADDAGVDVAYDCEGFAWVAHTQADVSSASFREGDVPGVRVWQLPDAPGGDRPDQSWLAVGSDPDGNIYISGHDHRLNSMLYRLDPETGSLTWVGDARTASTAADNWAPGETAEKFHTRPTHHDGRLYVATLDKSSIDDAFLSTRGFHWYGYDLESGDFVDLSADEPGGVGAAHLQVVTISADPVNDRVYGMTIPDNQLLYYDVPEGRTTVIGTPDEWQGYFYSNRFMWTDSRGNVYVTGGTERSQWNRNEDHSVLDSVWRYTPDSGFEDTGFALQTLAAIEVGQWNSAHDTLYVSDDMGHIYRFTDATATWEYLGRPDFPAGETSSGLNKVWVFQLDPGEETIYLGRSDNAGRPNEIWEFDIDTGSSSVLAVLPDLDALAGREAFITGYDSWDDDGNFYISSFSMYDAENAYLIGLDPEQIRSAEPGTEPVSP